MLHLDYILYVILIILVFILINKVFFKEIINEGFEHEGKGFIAAKPKTDEEKEGKEKPDSNMIIATKISYKTAEQVAYILIKMPYQFLAKLMLRLSDFMENLNDLIVPIKKFIKKMFELGKRIFMKFYNRFMGFVKRGFKILRNLPAFLEFMFKKVIDMIADMAEKLFETLENLFGVIETLINLIMELPLMIFDILNQLIDIIVNTAMMIIKLPGKILDVVINLQDQGLSLMDKSFSIPFMDLFFK